MTETPAPVALVTGAASGIGRAAAMALAARGWRLALVDRSEAALEAAARTCAEPGAECAPYLCDVTDDQAVGVTCEAALARFGQVDTLITAAGIGRYAPFLEFAPDEFRQMLEINVVGSVLFVRALLQPMLDRGDGAIILIGSRRGIEPRIGTSAYSASKGAVLALASSLAIEYSGRGIAVTCFVPGATKTGLGTPKDDRYLDPAIVGEAIAFVCAERGRAWIRDLTIMPLGL